MTIHGIVTAHVTTVGMKPSSSFKHTHTHTNTQVAYICTHTFISSQSAVGWMDCTKAMQQTFTSEHRSNEFEI